ncbi:hydrogenase 4 membrane subunit [Lebetimonas sp. JH369]|uniref:hydrogenase 4 membrane subunit n=1 Tax=Lebetimonas sp. JH369 TaxID=990069 RepID=UPI0004637471|nr:hydrogenase 4 membrane subunit [Lebetimonas sp. JH369]
MDMVSFLAILMIIASFLVFSLRNLKFATYAYILETLLLVGIFFTLAGKYQVNSLYGWAVNAFIIKVLIVPYIILRLINKLGVKSEETPVEGFFVSPVIALGFSLAIAMMLFPVLKSFALLKEDIPLVASLTIYSLGIFGLILRKNAVKQILSLCLFENGTHLTLALVAYNSPEIVDIGILTDAIFAVIIMSILATRFYKFFGSLDTSKANTLKG